MAAEEGMGLAATGLEFLLGADENVLKLHYGDSCVTVKY